MGRMKIGMAIAAAAVGLMGVVAVTTLGGPGSSAPNTVASQAAVATPPAGDGHPKATITEVPASIAPGPGGSTGVAGAGTTGPGTAMPIILPAHPTAEDVQRILAGITAEIMTPPASTATTPPLTKAQVEQDVRSKLSQLGINF